VVVIDIDEESIAKHGRWPWPREKMSLLVDRLFEQNKVKVLGFDIVFSEAQTQFSQDQVKQLLREQQQSEESLADQASSMQDDTFSKSLQNRQVVLGYFFEQIVERKIPSSIGLLPKPFFDLNAVGSVQIASGAPMVDRYTANLPILQNAAASAGFFNLSGVEDVDGVIRRVSLMNNFDDKLYSSLALKLLEEYYAEEVLPVFENGALGPSIEQLLVGDKSIVLGVDAEVYVPYSTIEAVHRTISVGDILDGNFDDDLSNSITIVGTSAPGLLDLRSTPVASSYPGVYVHANVLDGLFNDQYRLKTSSVLLFDFLIAILVGVLLSFLLPRLKVVKSTYVFVAIVVSLLCLNMYAWSQMQIVLSIAPVMLLAMLIFILNMVFGFFIESRSKQTMQSLFGLYVPPDVVNELCEREDDSLFKTQKRVMTVLFLDIRDFTSITESVDPEVVSEFLNQFFTKMTEIVHRHGGAVDKYMGDSLMAFWGAPLPDKDHASKAILAAQEMVEAKKELNQQFVEAGLNLPYVEYGIGVNSGLMSVGNMGSKFRMAYTVVGDAVNLGSRIEGLTREYDTNLIISEFSKELAPDFDYEKIDEVTVKGKSEQVTIFRCLNTINS
jgi:adenylate cyclase